LLANKGTKYFVFLLPTCTICNVVSGILNTFFWQYSMCSCSLQRDLMDPTSMPYPWTLYTIEQQYIFSSLLHVIAGWLNWEAPAMQGWHATLKENQY